MTVLVSATSPYNADVDCMAECNIPIAGDYTITVEANNALGNTTATYYLRVQVPITRNDLTISSNAPLEYTPTGLYHTISFYIVILSLYFPISLYRESGHVVIQDQ